MFFYTYGLKQIRNISTAASSQVETIGDAYMVVSGAPEKEGNHAERVCDMALDMVDAITDLKDPSTGKYTFVFFYGKNFNNLSEDKLSIHKYFIECFCL